MNSKPLWQSRTFWVNALTLTAGLLATIGGSELIEDYPRATAIVGSLLGAVNIGLRLVTDKPVTIK